MMKWWWNLHKT